MPAQRNTRLAKVMPSSSLSRETGGRARNSLLLATPLEPVAEGLVDLPVHVDALGLGEHLHVVPDVGGQPHAGLALGLQRRGREARGRPPRVLVRPVRILRVL